VTNIWESCHLAGWERAEKKPEEGFTGRLRSSRLRGYDTQQHREWSSMFRRKLLSQIPSWRLRSSVRQQQWWTTLHSAITQTTLI